MANTSDLVPDITLRLKGPGYIRWLMVESKMGTVRSLEESARASLLDLFAYEKAFAVGLTSSTNPIGLGTAWGSGLDPVIGSHMLCTPDTIPAALDLFVQAVGVDPALTRS